MKDKSEDIKVETKSEEELIAEAYKKMIKYNVSINNERDQLRTNAMTIGCLLNGIVESIGLVYGAGASFKTIEYKYEVENRKKEDISQIDYYFSIGYASQSGDSVKRLGFWIRKYTRPVKGYGVVGGNEKYYNFSDVGLDVIEEAMYYITDFLTDYLAVVVQKEWSIRGARERSEKIIDILDKLGAEPEPVEEK